ncbi:hypothetical protein TNIN_188571 [Trichonephila inaurata madagascariensis]|uniref:Uncharacterized protein n=1 Tax=Trichonephila inaurata madagascariensis TaxID=2747483 RepID=A0A8X6MK03_9ARAC|nr:hypothetical protein TNIN_188571 [Trichonephila inaurata madagascariensis]
MARSPYRFIGRWLVLLTGNRQEDSLSGSLGRKEFAQNVPVPSVVPEVVGLNSLSESTIFPQLEMAPISPRQFRLFRASFFPFFDELSCIVMHKADSSFYFSYLPVRRCQ